MTTRVTAVYENGVLRPAGPLPFAEGETVEVVVESSKADPGPPGEDDVTRRIAAARTLAELFEVLNEAPDEDDGYDLLEALNENRRAAGVPRLLFPPEHKGKTW